MRVLLVRAGALGDVLLLRRALVLLQDAGHQVGLMAPAASAAALAGSGRGRAESLIAWDRPDVAALLAGTADLPPRLRSDLAGFELAIAYTNSLDTVRALGRCIARVVAQPPLPLAVHASLWACLPLQSLCGPPLHEPPPLTATPAEAAGAAPLLAQLPARFLSLHPGSGSPSKNWPAERFAALVEPGAPFLLVEGPADREAAGALRHLPGAVLARGLPPSVLGATLAHASAHVGNDSGVTHLAAAWGARVIALFGATDPALWAPVGTHVRVLRAPDGRLERLAVETVRQALEQIRAQHAAAVGRSG